MRRRRGNWGRASEMVHRRGFLRSQRVHGMTPVSLRDGTAITAWVLVGQRAYDSWYS